MLEAQEKVNQKEKEAKQRHDIRRMKQEVKETGFSIEPVADDLINPIYNFTRGQNTSGRYRRMDMVLDSGAFVSGIPSHFFPEYDLRQSTDIDADGGRRATGETIPIIGERRLQVSLVKAVDDLMMSFKVVEGLTKPLGSAAEMVRNDCRVVFDAEATGGSYVYNRRRNEYYKIFRKN